MRNADGDELLFVHQGEAELFCDYGHLSIREGDYVVLPRGTMWRITHEAPVALLLVEASNDSYRLPDKGLVGGHAIFDPANKTLLLANPAVKIRFWKSDMAMDHLVRNADGDELLFVHQGEAELFCDYGHLSIREGDYVVLPRGTMWRITHEAPVALLLVEASNDSYRLPDKGLVGGHAIFDPAMLDTPKIDDAFIAQQTEEPWQVQVKRRGQISTLTYPFNPLDAVGWHGSLLPVRINWRDIRPLMHKQ